MWSNFLDAPIDIDINNADDTIYVGTSASDIYSVSLIDQSYTFITNIQYSFSLSSLSLVVDREDQYLYVGVFGGFGSFWSTYVICKIPLGDAEPVSKIFAGQQCKFIYLYIHEFLHSFFRSIDQSFIHFSF